MRLPAGCYSRPPRNAGSANPRWDLIHARAAFVTGGVAGAYRSGLGDAPRNDPNHPGARHAQSCGQRSLPITYLWQWDGLQGSTERPDLGLVRPLLGGW